MGKKGKELRYLYHCFFSLLSLSRARFWVFLLLRMKDYDKLLFNFGFGEAGAKARAAAVFFMDALFFLLLLMRFLSCLRVFVSLSVLSLSRAAGGSYFLGLWIGPFPEAFMATWFFVVSLQLLYHPIPRWRCVLVVAKGL